MNSFLGLLLLAMNVNAQATSEGIFAANAGIVNWLSPNAFVGIFLMIMILWVSCCTISALSQIGTPRILLKEPLEWGKIEKTED